MFYLTIVSLMMDHFSPRVREKEKAAGTPQTPADVGPPRLKSIKDRKVCELVRV